MFVFIIYFTVLLGFGVGQRLNIVCAPGRRINYEDFTNLNDLPDEQLVALAEDIFTSQMQGLTIEEAALEFPSAYNETIIGLTFSGLVNESDYFFLNGPMFDAILNYPNISEILFEISKTPDLYVQTIRNVLLNWNLSCSPDSAIVAYAFGTDMLRRIFFSENKNNITDIIVGLIVQSTKAINQEESMRAFLAPMVDGLEAAKAGGSLSQFLGLLNQDVLTGIIRAALRSTGWDTDFDDVSVILADFIMNLQDYLGVEDLEMLDVLGDVFTRMLDQLD
eukprot:TRINITY_DN11009_c0_g1_i2.p2 TRINITY_DN11009_c0_g1~~TRINITY_DN11009_c0_g1_i2.p2  ORF type:complete len:295 (-),score=34.65 TRINITY_DN11009_c0_g1_i2:315-1148(-)